MKEDNNENGNWIKGWRNKKKQEAIREKMI